MRRKTLIIAVLLGFIAGFAAVCYFYSAVLDKPETYIGKQKVKGRNNSVKYINDLKNGKKD
jgi:F0F1-type ATP synthase assembly protein I